MITLPRLTYYRALQPLLTAPSLHLSLWAVQEMYEEYAFSSQRSGSQGPPARLLVFLFPAREDDGCLLSPEEDLDGCDFLNGTG